VQECYPASLWISNVIRQTVSAPFRKIQMTHLRPRRCSSFFRRADGRKMAIRATGKLKAAITSTAIAKKSESICLDCTAQIETSITRLVISCASPARIIQRSTAIIQPSSRENS
jgi:hypothetical protein